MKSALAIVLTTGLMGGFPLSAQEPGPIARAMDREANRLATEPATNGERSSRIKKDVLIGAGIGAASGAFLGGGACSYSCSGAALVFAAGGAGVGALVGAVVGAAGGRSETPVFVGQKRPDIAPGTEVKVSARGAPSAPRYFVDAGEIDIILLNTSSSMLRGNAARALRDIAARHPESLVAAEAGSLGIFDNLHLGPDGVFLDGRRVADMTQILERIPRTDLDEGRSRIVVPGSKGMSLPGRIALGIGVGFGAAVFTGAALCTGRCGG